MNDRPRLNFLTYTLMLYQSGMIALGKVELPGKRASESKPEEAKGVLELLELLEEKTRGNRNTEEDKTLAMVTRTLSEAIRNGENGSLSPDSASLGEGIEIH
jgi:hypothetical protein